ncbi:UDP-galactopyranose mutase [Plastoroseomonas hellenica]|uniref:UDP-galactopyranose mutase n=1 Tax=Plastoroseomonas hellenica TaxID=2687306 RepID=UPI001BA79361|nr:UDP-galactopyranose mutase [Plastoroseomonas hellenica]
MDTAGEGRAAAHAAEIYPLICFSHLRWDSVFQRPQQLMSRFAQQRDVSFFEEALQGETDDLRIHICPRTNVRVLTPILRDPFSIEAVRKLLDGFLEGRGPATAWYYTPMALAFSDHVPWTAIAFDCMDELSAFRFAPEALKVQERRLMRVADVVFTGGVSLFEARKSRHPNIHCFPSGVDLPHFAAARSGLPEPADQRAIGRPRIGYFGVIDERLDMGLLSEIARLRPSWQLVMLGPVAKLRPDEMPQAPSIHWLGGRDYRDLPAYLAHWDVALMPFAMNEATRFISPTKAPEYLAGGCRVVSTPICDVLKRFAGLDAVGIGADTQSFVAAIERAIGRREMSDFEAVDTMLASMSWDGIQRSMRELLGRVERRALQAPVAMTTPAAMADCLVVGAGFAGAVVAERLASAGRKVLIVDRRSHIGGNAFDEHDVAGILIHRYGPHIFHTNSDDVLGYLSRFTAWRPYEHRVLAQVTAGLVPMPINRTTLRRVNGVDLRSEAEAENYLKTLAEPVDRVVSAEDFVVTSVGRRLYEMFFRGYTRKQWGVDPSQLDRSVTARVPTRTSDDDRYFLDRHQCMPRHGYTRMFENMLDHDNITVLLGTQHDDLPKGRYAHMVYTGPVDDYFGRRFGPLPYRSLVFEHETLPVEFHQPVATINYPAEDTPYTRCTEFKHLTGQQHRWTSICRERSRADGDPYYPVPSAANRELFRRYEALADAEMGVTFLGRLGTYRYMNMDQVVGQALATARKLLAPRTEAVAVAAQ